MPTIVRGGRGRRDSHPQLGRVIGRHPTKNPPVRPPRVVMARRPLQRRTIVVLRRPRGSKIVVVPPRPRAVVVKLVRRKATPARAKVLRPKGYVTRKPPVRPVRVVHLLPPPRPRTRPKLGAPRRVPVIIPPHVRRAIVQLTRRRPTRGAAKVARPKGYITRKPPVRGARVVLTRRPYQRRTKAWLRRAGGGIVIPPVPGTGFQIIYLYKLNRFAIQLGDIIYEIL